MNRTVMIVEDDRPLQDAMSATLTGAGFSVIAAGDGGEALKLLEDTPVDLIITDVQMKPVDGHGLLEAVSERKPQLPVVMMTAYGTIGKAVEAMKAGASDYLVKPFEAGELKERVSKYLSKHDEEMEYIAEDPLSRQTFDLADRVAAKDVTVLLQGESGTGKEVVARFIHDRSPRKHGPFVAINCAAIPDNMLEAVLFGYEKGSFTGATDRCDGKFFQANEGTLLLDEVSEMELNLQAKLLRVLQEREVEPLGAKRPRPLNVRVVATSNRSLSGEVAKGHFREDLFYRLNVFPIEVPPLRARPADIEPLVRHFIAESGVSSVPVDVDNDALGALQRHRWPGNVRELKNVIERALVLLQGNVLKPSHLSLDLLPRDQNQEDGPPVLSGELKAQETRLILEALEASGGRKNLAAERLGISPRTLRYKLAKLRSAGIAIPGR